MWQKKQQNITVTPVAPGATQVPIQFSAVIQFLALSFSTFKTLGDISPFQNEDIQK